jgi:hypothetical protein
MAKMGQRKVSEKKEGGSDFISPVFGVNVVVPALHVEATATIAVGSTLGIPIMREGFITETDFLLSPVAPIAAVSTTLLLNTSTSI